MVMQESGNNICRDKSALCSTF